MKNRFFTGSSNCCDSVMFPSRSAMAPATAATMPGRSGQAKVTTQCVIVLLADKSVVTLTGSRLVVEGVGAKNGSNTIAREHRYFLTQQHRYFLTERGFFAMHANGEHFGSCRSLHSDGTRREGVANFQLVALRRRAKVCADG